MAVELTYRVTAHGQAAIITLNRPEALNALSFEIIALFGAALDEVAKSGARVLIITGAGKKAFCAGADIKELRNRSQAAQKSGAELGQATFAKIASLPMPSIALINGYAFGGGLEIALACTFRLATANAKMGLPEIKLGLIPGYGGTQRLPRLIGEARAMDMILSGRAVAADEAWQMGLVNQVIPADYVAPSTSGAAQGANEEPALAAAINFAQSFTGFSLPVLALAQSAVSRAADTPLHEGLKIEADLSTLAYQTHDAEEGMAAFEAKRPAQFRDE